MVLGKEKMEAFDRTVKEHNGHKIILEWFADYDHGAPWEEEDGHGKVRETRTPQEKAPGEWVMHDNRGNYWLYDFQGAVKTAKADGWGIGEDEEAKLAKALKRQPTANECAVRAVELDFAHLRGWLRDEWFWVGYVIKCGEYEDSCWGFESDYRKEQEEEAIGYAMAWLDKEDAERAHAACCDVATV